MQSSWQGHWQSSLSSYDECWLSAKWLPTLRPSQLTRAVIPPVGCRHLHPLSAYIQPKGWYLINRPTEGRRLSQTGWLAKYGDGSLWRSLRASVGQWVQEWFILVCQVSRCHPNIINNKKRNYQKKPKKQQFLRSIWQITTFYFCVVFCKYCNFCCHLRRFLL